MHGRGAAALGIVIIVVVTTMMSFTASGARRPAYGGTLRLPTDSPLHTLDPLGVRWPAEATLASMIYDTPYKIAPNGRALPHLLRPVTTTGGGRTIRFKVRQHAVFHDGSPVRATHVISSLQRLASSRGYGWLLSMVSGASSRKGVSGIQLVGTNTVQIKLRSARSLELLVMALATPQAGVASSARKAVKGVGTGPFVLRSRKGADRRLRANRDYFDGPPYLNEVVLLGPIARDDHIRRFQLGEADGSLLGDSVYGESPPPAAVSLTEGPPTQLVYLIFNTTKGVSRDMPLRRAVDLALDRMRLAGTSASPMGYPGSKKTSLDQTRARSLISGLGYSTSSRSLVLLVEEGDAFGVFLAPQIQRDLSAVGLPVTREIASQAEARRRLASGAWDMRLQTLNPVSPDEVLQLGQILALGGMRSEATRLIEHASTKRGEAIKRATSVLSSELPVIPLCKRRPRLHHGANIRGASYDHIGRLTLAQIWLRPRATSARSR